MREKYYQGRYIIGLQILIFNASGLQIRTNGGGMPSMSDLSKSVVHTTKTITTSRVMMKRRGNMFLYKRKKSRGWQLAPLLAVSSIILPICMLVVPSYKYTKKSREIFACQSLFYDNLSDTAKAKLVRYEIKKKSSKLLFLGLLPGRPTETVAYA